jgi:hypothetical protein
LATINRRKKGQNQKQNKKITPPKNKNFCIQNTAGCIKNQQATFDIKKRRIRDHLTYTRAVAPPLK